MTAVMEPEVITYEDTETEDGPVAHIVKTKPGQDAIAAVYEARLYGTPIEALCGHVWVPERDPKNLPVCQKCKEIFEAFKAGNENLSDDLRY